MKQHTTIKNNKWVWPIIDEASWEGQQDCLTLPQFLLPYVENKNIMIQAGGNCGFLLSQFIPHFETIYTFEPDPINFYCLNQKRDDSRVIKIQGCLGNNNTPVNIQQLIRENMPHDIGGVHISGQGLVPIFKIDDLNLPACDLIQLDIEGYEYEALLGAVKTIEKYKPVLCVEMHDGWLNRYGATQDKITDLLSQYGYEYVFTHHMDKFFVVKK